MLLNIRYIRCQHQYQIYLYCTVLHCTALYCTVLYYTVLYCTVLYCTVLYCTVSDIFDEVKLSLSATLWLECQQQHCAVLYCTVLYCTVLYCNTFSQELLLKLDDSMTKISSFINCAQLRVAICFNLLVVCLLTSLLKQD